MPSTWDFQLRIGRCPTESLENHFPFNLAMFYLKSCLLVCCAIQVASGFAVGRVIAEMPETTTLAMEPDYSSMDVMPMPGDDNDTLPEVTETAAPFSMEVMTEPADFEMPETTTLVTEPDYSSVDVMPMPGDDNDTLPEVTETAAPFSTEVVTEPADLVDYVSSDVIVQTTLPSSSFPVATLNPFESASSILTLHRGLLGTVSQVVVMHRGLLDTVSKVTSFVSQSLFWLGLAFSGLVLLLLVLNCQVICHFCHLRRPT